ncbi:helix-turn-helix domain-containing protein [Streptomyces sp. NBC_00316]
MPDDGTAEKRNLLCAPLTDGTATRFCTTHITTSQSFNVAQLESVRQKLEDYHTAGETVLIAGDFNAQPHYGRLNSFYAPSLDVPNNGNNTGAYRELDDNDTGNCLGYGKWTADGTPGAAPPCGGNTKTDLISVRESALAGPYSEDSLAISTSCTGVATCSDHRIVVGTVTVSQWLVSDGCPGNGSVVRCPAGCLQDLILEVVVGRRPGVFVRPVSMEEGRRLQRISRTAKDPVRLRRAIAVMMSAQGQAVRDIVSLMQVSEDYVRDVIHAFNERGFDALDPKWSGGRPKTINDRMRERICLIARTSPTDWGIAAFSTWSLAKLAEHLVQRPVVPTISRETLRRILREGKVSWQTTTTWKASTDPDFLTEMHRVLELYDAPPADGMRRRVRPAQPDAAQGQGLATPAVAPPSDGHPKPV